jgi:hypothetical protein
MTMASNDSWNIASSNESSRGEDARDEKLGMVMKVDIDDVDKRFSRAKAEGAGGTALPHIDCRISIT